jgi:hypothetical protein
MLSRIITAAAALAFIAAISAPAAAGGINVAVNHPIIVPHVPQVPVTPMMRKSGGGPYSAGTPFLQYRFGTVFTTK